MTNSVNASLAVLLTCCIAGTSIAADFNYEVTLDYGRASSDSINISTVNGVPDPSIGTTFISSDSDDFGLTGTWYYSGLSDANGPKSRAAFLSRASGVSIGYSRDESSSSFDFGGGIFPPVAGTAKSSTNAISLRLRHVWRDNGWYVLAGLMSLESKISSVLNGNAVSGDADASAYSVGVGKYLGKQTAVELSVSEADAEGFDSTNFALSLNHVGSVGSTWQYGIDFSIAKSDQSTDEGSYTLRGSLFPTPDFEFGLAFSQQRFDFGVDRDSVEGFAGWFVSDNVALFGKYAEDLSDNLPGADSDNSVVGVGVTVRF